MPALFEAYVTNLGKYNEGELVGEYLKFPTTPEEVQALLKRIGIDGVRYEEIFITDFDGDVLGLYDHLGEYENIDELNHLACVISELDQSDLEKFEAVIDSGEYTGSVKELINLAQNLDCFEFYPGVTQADTSGQLVPKSERRLATAAVCRIERRAAYGHNLFQEAQDQQGGNRRPILERAV